MNATTAMSARRYCRHPMSDPRVDGWPLVGRELEIARIRGLVGGSHSRSGGVIIAGTAGIGKTALARAVAVDLPTHRWASATASTASIPLVALTPWTDGDVSHVSTDPLGDLLRSLAALTASHNSACLVVDDVHLLDPLSASVLHHLVGESTVSLLLTARADVDWPDGVRRLWTDGLLERMDLEALEVDDVGNLLAQVLDGRIDVETVERLHAKTMGQPMLLRELVRTGLADGTLVAVHGTWRWHGQITSPRLGDLIGDRLTTADPAEEEAMILLGCAEPLPLLALDRVVGSAPVAALARRGIVTTDPSIPGMVRFGHPMYGDVVRQRADPVTTMRLRASLVAAMHGIPTEPLVAASLFLDAGLDGGAELLTEGAQRAISLLDHALGLRLATAAVGAGGGVDAMMALATAQLWLGAVDAGSATLEHAADMATSDDDVLRVALAHAPLLYWGMGRDDEARALLDTARTMASNPEAALVTDAMTANFDLLAGNLDDAAERAGRTLSVRGAPAVAVLWAAIAMAMVAALRGVADLVPDLVDRALDALRDDPDRPIHVFTIAVPDVLARRLSGNLREAAERADHYRALARSSPVGPGSAVALLLAGEVALDRGLVRSAAALLRDSLARLRDFDIAGWRSQVLPSLAVALALTGDPAGAEQALDDREAVRHPLVRHREPEVALARCWALAAAGHRSAAQRAARDAIEQCVAAGQPAIEARARHALVRLGVAADQVEPLQALVERIDGPLIGAMAVHARALAVEDGVALDLVADEFSRCGFLLAAADAAAQASSCHRRRGRRVAAHASAATAARLAELCEGARTPAIDDAARPLPLTSREREVAELAGRGRTNREIADALFVSIRTVESHVQSTFRKLGVNRRADLADLALSEDRRNRVPDGPHTAAAQIGRFGA